MQYFPIFNLWKKMRNRRKFNNSAKTVLTFYQITTRRICRWKIKIVANTITHFNFNYSIEQFNCNNNTTNASIILYPFFPFCCCQPTCFSFFNYRRTWKSARTAENRGNKSLSFLVEFVGIIFQLILTYLLSH